MFSEPVRKTLAEIEHLDEEQKKQQSGIPLWRVAAETGRLLYILVRACNAQRAVEVGTSSGYSGIHIGAALQSTGGHLWTLDLEPYKIELARRNFAASGLSDRITQVPGDALVTLKALVDEPFDFVFLDAVKPDYLRYLELVRPALKPGSVVCADNVGPKQARHVQNYLEAVRRPPFVTSVVPTTNSEAEVDAIAVSVLAE